MSGPHGAPSRTASLAREFWRHPDAGGLLAAHHHVLVALSGGLDSVVLLHLLRFTAPRALRITAAHFDHAMRRASGRDAAWVRGLCRAWGVPLVEARAEAPLRSEDEARSARYAFLEDAADRAGADAILTAHQLDDQAETVLFRLARGTGLTGLAGIPRRRGRVLRPLLPFGRALLLSYARDARARWREDETNLDPAFARNRIRGRVLPALAAGRPQAAAQLARLAAAARSLEETWKVVLPQAVAAVAREGAEGGYELARGALREYHPGTRARVMRYLLQRLGALPTRAGLRAALQFIDSGESGTGVCLKGGVRVEREFDRILLRRPAEPGTGTADRPIRILAPRDGRAEGRVGGRVVRATWGRDVADAPGARHASFDPAALRFPLVLRRWQPGDRITLGYGTKKVKELLRERRIGRSVRSRVVVLAEQESPTRVLWVVDAGRTALVPDRGECTWHITVEHGESG